MILLSQKVFIAKNTIENKKEGRLSIDNIRYRVVFYLCKKGDF